MDAALLTILGFGFLMSLIAVIGGLFVIPEVKRLERLRETGLRFAFFVFGAALLYAVHAFKHM